MLLLDVGNINVQEIVNHGDSLLAEIRLCSGLLINHLFHERVELLLQLLSLKLHILTPDIANSLVRKYLRYLGQLLPALRIHAAQNDLRVYSHARFVAGVEKIHLPCLYLRFC